MFEGGSSLSFSNVSVFGLGYIGLPTAAIIASQKIPVTGIDINVNTVSIINQGKIHIVEPDLDTLVHSAVSQGLLHCTITPEFSDIFLIAVPTPFTPQYEADLSYIKSAAESIAKVLKKGDLVILESTSPVGTTDQLARWLAEIRSDLTFPHQKGENSDIRVAYCPERVLPGNILRELKQNDRVIGGLTPACAEKARELYQVFVTGKCIITTAQMAEMCKLAENTFRDLNIAFANELSLICSLLNIDIWELIDLANRHPRVNILKPGPGVGGHCLAVDPWFLINSAPEVSKLTRTAREVNDNKPLWVLEQIQASIKNILDYMPNKSAKDITISCLGLSFKADIDDLRESPSLKIVEGLTNIHPGPILIVEPHIEVLPTCISHKTELKQLEEAILETDILVILVNHKKFKKLTKSINNIQVLDFCGALSVKNNND